MRSESWTFIWQPNVSIRYFRAIVVLAELSLSPVGYVFAFACRVFVRFGFRFAVSGFGAHFSISRALAMTRPILGPADHARDFLFPLGPVDPRDTVVTVRPARTRFSMR